MHHKSSTLGSAAFGVAFALVASCGGSEQGDTDLGFPPGSGGTGLGGTGGTIGLATGGNGAVGGSATPVGGAATGVSSGGTTPSGAGGTPSSGEACHGLPVEDGEAGAGVEACRGISYEAEATPVDLYVMMDRSVSLSEVDPASGATRWDALRTAMGTFVNEAADQDLRIGMGFFGRTGGNDDSLDCDAAYYALPTVEIGKLSEVGGAILDAMTEVRPGGFTPTAPALEGALRHAGEWATENPGRSTAVVLVTDGYPTQCEPRAVSGIAELVESAHVTEPYVRTYVIGLAAGFNLDGIARAGGTGEAYRVDEGDATASLLLALRNVSNTKLACRYEIPSPPGDTMSIDHDAVQVRYTSTDGSVEEVPSISGLDACSRNPNGGWYYDDPQSPAQILVCPCTCSRFEAGRVDVTLGCKPSVGIR